MPLTACHAFLCGPPGPCPSLQDLRIEAADDAVHKVIITDPEGASADKFFLQVQNCGVIFDGVIVKKSSGDAPVVYAS